MSHLVSATTFVRDAFLGFCLFESMASWLPLVDDFTILDLGSIDGTLPVLEHLASKNPKIRVFKEEFTRMDASAFADAANRCIELAKYENVVFYQADEIPHPYLLRLVRDRFKAGEFDLSFWRYQLKENFQVVKWLPHIVHRVGHKSNFNFVVDGMNTDRTGDAKLVYDRFSGGCFPIWATVYNLDGTKKESAAVDQATFESFPPMLPTNEMILDVSKCGGFRNIVRQRAEAHFPFWSDPWPNVDGERLDAWWLRESDNENWHKEDTPFDIPPIMQYHLGKLTYELRDYLVYALSTNQTAGMVML